MNAPIMRVLFVCAGNTCRSPMAESLLRHRVAEVGRNGFVEVVSAGVSAKPGHPINPAARDVLRVHGLVYDGQARLFDPADWAAFDYILAMDRRTLKAVNQHRVPGAPVRATARLLLDFARGVNETEVFDPYGTNRYREAFSLIEKGVDGFWDRIRKDHNL